MPEPDEGGPPIRAAATIVLWRESAGRPQVLMGQRGSAAVFMPDLYVFPGGAVDAADAALPVEVRLEPETARRLAIDAGPDLVRALPLAAIRELWEETGLLLGRTDPAAAGLAVPADWAGFFAAGLVPDTEALRLIFRAVTPPGRPRRFDARFFLAEAGRVVAGDLAHAGEELRHLRWLDMAEARALPLPFITEVVLAEVTARLASPTAELPVPFFDHTADASHFRLL